MKCCLGLTENAPRVLIQDRDSHHSYTYINIFYLLIYHLLDLDLSQLASLFIGLQETRTGFSCPIPSQTKVIPFILLFVFIHGIV